MTTTTTRFTITVMDGDRVVRWANNTAPAPLPSPAETPGEDTDVWSGHGPPPIPAPPGYENHDYYIDLDSGEVYQLNQ